MKIKYISAVVFRSICKKMTKGEIGREKEREREKVRERENERERERGGE